MAMGCSVERARGSVRFSLGIYNTQEEVDYVLKHLPGVIAKLRGNEATAEPSPPQARHALARST
jgi:cysteine desulfurase